MEDQACPKCKTTLYRNPNMKLLVNVCGHNLCESCVELLFVKGSGNCPECGIPLRRANFRIQLFEDASIDKEVDIRRRVLRDFNKKEEDFAELNEYNDYLEMIEDLIFNLTNNIDIQETNRRIAEYKEVNKDFISKNRHKISKERLELEDILAAEKKADSVRKIVTDREEEAQKKAKVEDKEKLIDDLMFSDAKAEDIVNQHESIAKENAATASSSVFSTGLQIGGQSNTDSSTEIHFKAVKFEYVEPEMFWEGPQIPLDSVESAKYHQFVRKADKTELAAGFHQKIPCARALQEAMCGLFFNCDQ